jgi:adenosylmethionine-8-amino-7-oxononanoate aminotransferase
MDMDLKKLVPRLFLDFMQMREFAEDPLVFAGGEGIRLTDIHGKQYIDGLSGALVVNLGHGNMPIVEAMMEQAKQLAFTPPLLSTNVQALKLTELLLHIAPAGVGAVKLLSGGSEATETAIKLARQYHKQAGNPRKYKIVSRYGSYHGATMGALSAGGGRDRKSVFEPLGVGFVHVHPPYCFQCPFDQVYPTCGRTCATLLERTIEAEDPDTVAAVILEPVSVSSAGFIVPPPDYLPMVRETCTRHNAVLIYDEVLTGFGRLGTMFGSEHFGTVPDITCCGKGMSGGYAPLAAVLIHERIAQAFYGTAEERREFHHGHTFGGNPIACAAGIAAITQMLDRDLVGNARRQGARLRSRLTEMEERHPIVGDVRGAGLLQGVEFVQDRRTSRARFPAEARPGKIVERAARERGMLMRCADDFVVLGPPLIVSAQDVDEMCSILEECVAVAERELKG